MSSERIIAPRDFDSGFSFVSYGVRVGIQADSPTLLKELRGMVERAFGGIVQIFEEIPETVSGVFGLRFANGIYSLSKNGFEITGGQSKRNVFKYLNGLIRLEVAENVIGYVFLHAGVVGWNGRAIILPAVSFSGKSTLTAELVRNGAQYYSDEYAVLDSEGMVHPFPRHLSLRYFGATREREVSVEELGGHVGNNPIPVGMVLLTKFVATGVWAPESLEIGTGIMELVPNTLNMRRNPEFSLKVLESVARRAIIVRSPRGDVKKFAKFLLAFFDKHSKLAKMT